MKNETKKHTYNGLDVGKFICAFLILFYHYFSEHGPLPGWLDEVLSLYAIAVALFMSISGFLLFNKLENVVGTKRRWEIVKRQVIRIYSIYFLWSIPYLAYVVSRWDWSSISIDFILWQIQGWVFSSTFYTIWFMPMLAIGILLTFWLTEKLPECVVLELSILCYIVGAFSLTYQFVGYRIPLFSRFAEFANLWLGGARGWLFYAFPLIMAGRFVVGMKGRMKPVKMAMLSIVCVTLMLGEALTIRYLSGGHTGIDLTFMMVPTVMCILGFLISLQLPEGKCYIWMRNMSTLIFMSQRLFLTVLPRCFPTLFALVFLNDYVGAIIITALTVLLSMFVIYISKKGKVFRRLY